MNQIKTDLESLLVLINIQIDEIELEAARNGIEASQLRTADGKWPMAELLVAKANVVIALSQMRPSALFKTSSGHQPADDEAYMTTDEYLQNRM